MRTAAPQRAPAPLPERLGDRHTQLYFACIPASGQWIQQRIAAFLTALASAQVVYG